MTTGRVPSWGRAPGHRAWLAAERDRLLSYYETASLDPSGGFWWMGSEGRPLRDRPKYAWINARMVHAFALAHLDGRPGAAGVVDHGLDFLGERLHDPRAGGWFWAVDDAGPVDAGKYAYAHAFVALAAASAVIADFGRAAAILDEVLEVIERRFWEAHQGLARESWDRDWHHAEDYRGQNANMHLVEAFLAVADATGVAEYRSRAATIAKRLIGEITIANEGRLPEHYDAGWSPRLDYNSAARDDMFRPYGSAVGHWLEWARLLAQLSCTEAGEEWMLPAARTLFEQALLEGWDDARGGLRFTVDWKGAPINEDRYHWVIAEAIGAAAILARITGCTVYERWYHTFWGFAARHLIDRRRGSWHHQLDAANRPSSTVWSGKPDLYHSLQATLVAVTPPKLCFAAALRDAALDDEPEVRRVEVEDVHGG